MGMRDDMFVQAASVQARENMSKLKSQELSNLIHALGILRYREEILLGDLCTHIAQRLPNFSPQGCSSCVYALARLEFRHDSLLSAACHKVRKESDRFGAQG